MFSFLGLRDLEGFQMDVTGDDLYILASLSVYLNAVMEKALFFTDQVDSSYLMTEVIAHDIRLY